MQRSGEVLMPNCQRGSALEPLVVLARSPRADYGDLAEPVPAPELPSGHVKSVAGATVRELLRIWGLDPEHFDSGDWNPLGQLIKPGSRVVLKPNWVLHYNKSGHGMECLVTHTTLIEAVLEYVALTRPSRIVVGDAPVQGCDFSLLRAVCGLDEMEGRFSARGLNVSVADFRRTVLLGEHIGAKRVDDRGDVANYVRFDLQEESLLEPLARDAEKFRVTMYNPDLMRRTHGPRRHQYLIAREIMQADIVINLPKLKCHKKACITGALKNLVGINGNKEYLPHHRKGGNANGGDCYAGNSPFKGWAEALLDAANRRKSKVFQRWLGGSAELLVRLAQAFGSDDNMEGSWFGNDTIWRTCLDLLRLLRYGREDGNLAHTPQRLLVSITDAIVAGEGEGPMAPLPVPASFLTGAVNPAAAEWVHARLMGFDPGKIPLVRQAFSGFPYPLAAFDPSAVRVRTIAKEGSASEIQPLSGRAFLPAKGWKGHCELGRQA